MRPTSPFIILAMALLMAGAASAEGWQDGAPMLIDRMTGQFDSQPLPDDEYQRVRAAMADDMLDLLGHRYRVVASHFETTRRGAGLVLTIPSRMSAFNAQRIFRGVTKRTATTISIWATPGPRGETVAIAERSATALPPSEGNHDFQVLLGYFELDPPAIVQPPQPLIDRIPVNFTASQTRVDGQYPDDEKKLIDSVREKIVEGIRPPDGGVYTILSTRFFLVPGEDAQSILKRKVPPAMRGLKLTQLMHSETGKVPYMTAWSAPEHQIVAVVQTAVPSRNAADRSDTLVAYVDLGIFRTD